MKIIGIDPGNIYSAYCVIRTEDLRPIDFGKVENNELRSYLMGEGMNGVEKAAIEMVASYGMPVGREVFDTCRWIGRFEEMLVRRTGIAPTLIFRQQEKLHICHSPKANDATIRRALIDRFATHDMKNGRGTKKNPDWFYGISKDMWSAYSVALVAVEVVWREGSEET